MSWAFVGKGPQNVYGLPDLLRVKQSGNLSWACTPACLGLDGIYYQWQSCLSSTGFYVYSSAGSEYASRDEMGGPHSPSLSHRCRASCLDPKALMQVIACVTLSTSGQGSEPPCYLICGRDLMILARWAGLCGAQIGQHHPNACN